KPESPAPGLEVSREEVPGGKAPAGETNRPNLLKEEDLQPGQEEGATKAQGTISQPGIGAPTVGGNPPPQEKEGTTVPAQPEERPAPPPASEGTAARARESSAREEAAADRPGVSTSEPPGSAAQPVQDPAEGGWVRIPNKGRIPSGMGSDPVASGEA